MDYRIPVTAYPSDSGLLLVNSPGSGELKDGREGRWRKLARHLQALGLVSMVTYNVPRPDFQVQLEWEPYSYRGGQLEPHPHRKRRVCGGVGVATFGTAVRTRGAGGVSGRVFVGGVGGGGGGLAVSDGAAAAAAVGL